MSKNDFLVTIVVPTHNRSCYAIPCIKSILEISSSQVQVVVHDTSDDRCELKLWAESQADPRLKYVHWCERLSMTENHERALALAEGLYICLIGDDDTVSEKIIDAALYAKENKIKSLTPKLKASYYWPDFRSKIFGDSHAGRIYLEKFDGGIEKLDASKQLEKNLFLACQGTELLPKLYHGLVLREVISQAREKYGKIFFGTSPDISAALVLASDGGEHNIVDYPFTLPGGAGGSNSGRSASGKHKGDLEKDSHIKPFQNLQWPTVIPKFFSVETVWGQAAWETLYNVCPEKLSYFNLARLYALCFLKHSGYWRETLSAWRAATLEEYPNIGSGNLMLETAKLVFEQSITLLKRLRNPRASNGKNIIAIVDNIYFARKSFDGYLAESMQVIGGKVSGNTNESPKST